jgi:hypothetical protein
MVIVVPPRDVYLARLDQEGESPLGDFVTGRRGAFALPSLLSSHLTGIAFGQHVATLASLAGKKKYVYPKATLDEAWEKVLLNQCMSLLPSLGAS